MSQHVARGLPASWLNAWLAAIGVTVLCPEVRLSWTDAALPIAVFDTESEQSVIELVVAHWPSRDDVQAMAIAQRSPGEKPDQPKLSKEGYLLAAKRAREQHDDWSLSCLVTDLAQSSFNKEPNVQSRFYVGAPGSMPMHKRVQDCLKAIAGFSTQLVETIERSFAGVGEQTGNMGLAFSHRRIGSFVSANSAKDESSIGTVDPVIEVLAFFGLTLFPLRGDGVHARQRGWGNGPKTNRAFQWIAWRNSLDRWAIDGMLDLWIGKPASLKSDIIATFASATYDAPGSSNPLRAFASMRQS